ncbi:coiled-coil-helix-coiled-coil-helix domain-containing protein 1-like [Acanthaster planci]|uniref:Coiled-coil-helix-coiled-coil-helix domain-containing protein 1-like n=1 Tax=Acanthaster planci TaxID=133434 RepID=A0A8B7XJN5_ACAPL|nr:coiled-coil-helix-coiled-coil-helix domain-containing protein 1-like [Acanthaster planci]
MSKRMNEIILRNHYWPNRFEFRQREFKLRDKVALRKNRPGAAECITEMSVLMACWKKHDYNDTDCTEEIRLFEKCCMEAKKVRQETKAAVKSGKIAGKMTSQQATSLLQQFPQPR